MQTELENFGHRFIETLKTIFENTDLEKIDEVLDNRDDDVFSGEWTKAYSQIKNTVVEKEDKVKIDKIREEIFMLTIRKTHSSDLSAYISDDFDLIWLHYLNKTQNNWIEKLIATYFEHEIPQGILKNTDKKLDDLINKN